MSVCCECCVLSGRCLCDELITRAEESYRLWCVIVCDLETSRMRRPWPTLGHSAMGGGNVFPIWKFKDMFATQEVTSTALHFKIYKSGTHQIYIKSFN